MLSTEQSEVFNRILENQEEYYSIYHKKEVKPGGRIKWREIIAPNDEFKELQSHFYTYMVSNQLLPIHDKSYAWIKGKSTNKCALEHVDQRYVLEADISDFFGTISEDHIRFILVVNGIKEIDGVEIEDFIKFITIRTMKKKGGKPYLPQGFVTSTYFANAVRYRIDLKIEALAKDGNMIFNNYGDNIFLSGDSVPQELKSTIKGILNEYGFDMNMKKTKIMPYYRRQSILGITVNKKISTPKDYTNKVLSEVIHRVKHNVKVDSSLLGKVNVVRMSENHRNYNYLNQLINNIGE